MKKTIRAIQYAMEGLRYALVNERNFKIEIFCACFTIILGFFFHISLTSWLIIILNIGFVLTAELMNTSIEKLADIASKEINNAVKIIKDVAAAAVIIAVMGAFVSGLIIFIPVIIKTYFI